MNRDPFSSCHPIVSLTYFAAVLTLSMFFMHPVFQCIALIAAIAYSVVLKGRKALKFTMLYMIPAFLITAAINPAFNHAGVTILFYLKSGNPVTLESILYGVSAGAMFVTVLFWFSCCNVVMTSDKWIYLFGRIWPALSLVFSMALRFVPRYAAQAKVISNGQKCIGRDVTQGSIWARAKQGLTIVSMLTTWALENAIETSDSMKSRGYGLPGRSSFSMYRWRRRDQIIFSVLLVMLCIVLIGAAAGENTMRFFPSVKRADTTPFSLLIYFAYAALCLLPVIIHMLEELRWKFTQSRN